MQRSSVDLPLPFGPSSAERAARLEHALDAGEHDAAAVGVPDAAQLQAWRGHEQRDVERDRAEIEQRDDAVDVQERHVDAREVGRRDELLLVGQQQRDRDDADGVDRAQARASTPRRPARRR